MSKDFQSYSEREPHNPKEKRKLRIICQIFQVTVMKLSIKIGIQILSCKSAKSKTEEFLKKGSTCLKLCRPRKIWCLIYSIFEDQSNIMKERLFDYSNYKKSLETDFKKMSCLKDAISHLTMAKMRKIWKILFMAVRIKMRQCIEVGLSMSEQWSVPQPQENPEIKLSQQNQELFRLWVKLEELQNLRLTT